MVWRLPLSVLGGLLVAGGFEPIAQLWLLPVGLALFFGSLRHLTWWQGLLTGLGFGAAFMGAHQWWMLVLGAAPFLGITLLETLFLGLFGAIAVALHRVPAWPVWLAAWWVTVERLRSSQPWGGMPWGRLSYAVADSPVQPTLPWLGFTLVSFLLALIGGVLAWLVIARPGAIRGAATAIVVGCALVLPGLVAWQPATTRTAGVAVVQPDVPGTGDDLVAVHREVTSSAREMTEQLATAIRQGNTPAVDFVVWPENSTAVDPSDQDAHRQITAAVDAAGLPILLAAMVDDEDPTKIRNEGIVWQPDGDTSQRFGKRHPVPFGEWIPWRGTWITQPFSQLQQIPRDMVAGQPGPPLTIAGIRVADAICFDVAYDDVIDAQVRDGAELAVVQTSNATYIHTFQVDQQFAMTRLRAAANGRALAVSSTNGITALIGPDGNLLEEMPKRESGWLSAELPLSTSLTPATRLGEWPGRVLLVFALGSAAFAWIARRRR